MQTACMIRSDRVHWHELDSMPVMHQQSPLLLGLLVDAQALQPEVMLHFWLQYCSRAWEILL